MSDEGHETVGGVRVYVRDQGKGRPLVMLNGIGAGSETWSWLEERLAGSARTVAIELPGGGRSGTPTLPFSVAGLAGLVAGVLDRRGLEQVDVLGFSLGGIVAQQLAHERPLLVRRLALAATACGWGSMPGTLASLTLVSLPWRLHSRALYRQTVALMGRADRELLERYPELSEARLHSPPPVVGYTYQLVAGALWSSLPWLATVTCPTLVVAGQLDELVPPANAVQLARLLPESRLHVLPDEGHLLLWDPESRAVPLIEDFFTAGSLARSQAWRSGRRVDDDASVEAAFADSVGAQPHRTLSMAFRRLVEAAPI